MLKKLIVITTLLTTSLLRIQAEDNPIDGIFVWANGSTICYKLSEVPKVTYKEDAAILTIGDSTKPVLTIDLKNGASLIICYGSYESGNDIHANETSKVEKRGKYICGGKLVIVKDNKMYDVNGIEIKQ